jgi:hypothetical protein
MYHSIVRNETPQTIPLRNMFEEMQKLRKLGYPPIDYCKEAEEEDDECTPPSKEELLTFSKKYNNIRTILKTRMLRPGEVLQYQELNVFLDNVKNKWIIPWETQFEMDDILGNENPIEFRKTCQGCQFCSHSARIDVAIYYDRTELTRFRKRQSYLDFFGIDSEVNQIRTQYTSEPFSLPSEITRGEQKLKIVIRKWILLHSVCHCGDEKCLSLPIEMNITIPEKGKRTSKGIKIPHTHAAIFAILEWTGDKLILNMGEVLTE